LRFGLSSPTERFSHLYDQPAQLLGQTPRVAVEHFLELIKALSHSSSVRA
jgi:hypothetical protein